MKIQIPITNLTGIILAGGRSSRFGTDKAFAEYKGESFIHHVIRVMKGLFEEVMIVTNFPEKYGGMPVKVVKDKIPFQGPAGAIVTALRETKAPGIFVVACDMPLLSQEFILDLIQKDNGAPLVLYRHHKRVEPLCAVYRRSLLPLLEYRLRFGIDDLQTLCEEPALRVQKVVLKGPSKQALWNVNTPEDLEDLFSRLDETPIL